MGVANDRGRDPWMSPDARLAFGGILLACCLVASPRSPLGFLLLASPVAIAAAACGIRRRSVIASIGAIIMLAPFFGAACWASFGGTGHTDTFGMLSSPAVEMLERATAVSLVTIITWGSMSRSGVYDALASGALPALVVGIVVQVLQQTGALLGETTRMTAALRVRGAGLSARERIALLAVLSRVWLVRVVARAESLSAAMELRGYGIPLPRFRRATWSFRDIATMTLSMALLALSIVHRAGWIR